MNYVIIGNSAAAVGCVEALRSGDPAGTITLISSEPHHTYSRPLISYLLQGKTDEERMKYRPDDFYRNNRVCTKLGCTVTKIDAKNQKVMTDDGETISYSKLLIATGSRPFVPPMEGLETVKKQFHFMTLDDAKALEKALGPDQKVLIVGAGLIGLKCAEGILHRVQSVHVVDLADRILPSILDAEAAPRVQKHLEEAGVSFTLGASVKKFKANEAHLTNGEKVPFDVVVLAVGVRPNVELAKEAGCAVGRGIVVDENSKTTVANIYAAGDCTETVNAATGKTQVMALLPNAYLQGEAAGRAMTGGRDGFSTAIPENAIGFFGLHLITAGNYEGEADLVEDTETSYKKLFVKDGRLVGYMLIGDVHRAGIYTDLIRKKTPLASLDYDMLRKEPQLLAFSRTSRDAMLAKSH